jgi:hypothetical protein
MDTEYNNGVLIYLLLADRDVEIVADRGVHAKVTADAIGSRRNRSFVFIADAPLTCVVRGSGMALDTWTNSTVSFPTIDDGAAVAKRRSSATMPSTKDTSTTQRVYSGIRLVAPRDHVLRDPSCQYRPNQLRPLQAARVRTPSSAGRTRLSSKRRTFCAQNRVACVLH